MKLVASMYQDDNNYGMIWEPEALQAIVNSMNIPNGFKEELRFYLEAVHTIGKGSKESKERHAAYDVKPDGSCFYQSLFYGLLWTSLKDLENIHTIHQLKLEIMGRLFSHRSYEEVMKDFDEEIEEILKYPNLKENVKKLRKERSKDSGKEKEVLESITGELRSKLNRYYELISRKGVFETMPSDLGFLHQNFDKSDTSKWYRTDNTPFVGEAFGVQILIYTLQVENETLTRGTAKLAEYNNNATHFSGLPVICMLHNGVHFFIMDRQAFVTQGLVTEDGRGVKGKEIPQYVNFFYVKQLEKMMPYLNMCILCRKWILSD